MQHDAEMFEERDFFKQPLTEVELREIIGSRPVAEVFSWKSPSAKALGLEPETASADELIRLMLDEPRLIRRPLIQVGGELVIGLDPKRLENLLG